eukprot:NODE_409_length_9212_cov_0.585537.p8 type:complete len:147 gc:universal NODE_409_length_9212_cov_0.585537:2292-1852(-)
MVIYNNIGKSAVLTRQTTATLISKQNSEIVLDHISQEHKRPGHVSRNSMLSQVYTKPSLSFSSISSNAEKSKTSMKSSNTMDSIFTNEAINARMKYAFSSKQEDELSLDEDDEIEVIETMDNGWTVAKSHGKEGLVPTSYLEVMSY